MFENDYTIQGKHATFIKYLVKDAGVFPRYIDVYMTGAALGILHRKKAEENDSTDRARIYADAFSTERAKCMELFRTVILADNSMDWSNEERANICFRYRDREREGAVPPVTKEEVAVMKQALDLFNSYARGGIEILYEAFTSDAIINQDDAVDYAYKMIYDQQAHADVQSSDLDQLLKPEY